MGKTRRGPPPTQRQLRFWLNSNCPQSNNWIVQFQFNQIIGHSDAQYFRIDKRGKIQSVSELPDLSDDLRHIYFTRMTDDELITLVQVGDGRHLFVIHNSVEIQMDDEDEVDGADGSGADGSGAAESGGKTLKLTSEEIQKGGFNQEIKLEKVDDKQSLPEVRSIHSKIYQLHRIQDVKACLNRKTRQVLKLQGWSTCKLTQAHRTLLNKVMFLDLADAPRDQLLDVFTLFVQGQRLDGKPVPPADMLNLQHCYSVTDDLLRELTVSPDIKQILLQANIQLHDFSWLDRFPNLKLFDLWYCHQMEERHVEQICRLKPDLEVFNVHWCCRMNIRIMIHLLKLQKLTKLAIDDSQFWCQKGIHQLFVFPKEWKDLYAPGLRKLAINSKNLTLDVLDYIFGACPNLEQVLVDEQIMKMIQRNLINGHHPKDTVIFLSWQNLNKGFKAHKQVTFKNMFKDRYNSKLFSDSMLVKIKQMETTKQEQEQEAVMI